MINEGRGISELNKEETENLFNIFKKDGYQTFNHQILNRIVEISFSEGNYDSKFYKKSGKYYLLITCPKDYDELKFKTIITHVLNHFIEISKIEDKKYRYPNYNKIKKSLIEFNPQSKQLHFFKHLIYKTLDNEVNSNVSQTYTYLRSFNSSDKDYLKLKLEEYEVRGEYKNLLNFNISKFKNDIKSNNIDFGEFNEILIKNGVGDFIDFIYEENPDKYIDNWFKIIKSNIRKLLKKQDNIIKEVIEDIDKLNNYSSEYPISEKTILNYTEYLKENFINESKENVFDELSNIIIDKFNDKEYNFTINEYSKYLNKRRFKVKELKVKFDIKKDGENFCNGLCNVTQSEIKEDYLIKPSIIFEIGYLNLDDDFIKYICSVIKHEVLHLYQAYNLKVNNKFKPESWVIGSLLPTFRIYLKEDYSKVILNLLYISLSHEIYSQLQQYYFYKKDNLKYQKIENIIVDLNNFQIKTDLSDNEISEILNLKKFIIKGLKNNSNAKYRKDVDKSFWSEDDIYLFLDELNRYFKQKSDLIKSKLKKIDKELNFESKISDSLNLWISLPTNFEKTKPNYFNIIDDIIIDVLYS